MIKMGNNGFQGQIAARQLDPPYFPARLDIVSLIQQDSCISNFKIVKIGIVSPDKTEVVINNKPFEIGETHLLELQDVNITSLYFAQDSSRDAIVDYIISNLDN